MSSIRWIAAVALGWLVLGSVAGLAQEQNKLAPQQPPAPAVEQKKERPAEGKDAPAPTQPLGLELLPAIERIAAALREGLAKDKEADRLKEVRELADLQAQQDMAYWARWMFWASAAGVGLTAIGLGLIAATLYHTRRAADAAMAAVDEARRATKQAETTNRIVARSAALELRAYLTVLPAGISELIDTQRAMGHVDVKNVGKLPARNVWLQVNMTVADRDDRKGTPSKTANDFQTADDPKVNDSEFAVDRAIQPGTQIRQGAAEKDLISVADLLAQQNRYVYVWGAVYYDDGTKRRFTRFRHRYAIASHNRGEDWNQPATKTRQIIAIDKARYHPFGNDAN